jgi:hypothetical protein
MVKILLGFLVKAKELLLILMIYRIWLAVFLRN